MNKKRLFIAGSSIASLSVAAVAAVILLNPKVVSLEENVQLNKVYALSMDSTWSEPEQINSSENPVGLFDFTNVYEKDECFISLEQMGISAMKPFASDIEGTLYFAMPLGVPVLGKPTDDSYVNLSIEGQEGKLQAMVYNSTAESVTKYTMGEYKIMQATRVSAESKMYLSVYAGCKKDSTYDIKSLFSQVNIIQK